jgi:hypothetical protein
MPVLLRHQDEFRISVEIIRWVCRNTRDMASNGCLIRRWLASADITMCPRIGAGQVGGGAFVTIIYAAMKHGTLDGTVT